MELQIQKLNSIKSVDDWRQFAPPKLAYQWKDNRSAKLLAEYVLSWDYSNALIKNTINRYGFHCEKGLIGNPECVTPLPGFGEGRNHDLLIEGDDFVIGIEAKVSETFGRLISQELYNATDNKVYRINELAKYINKTADDLKDYRYQLLTGVVGTLLEAHRRHKNKCLFRVVVFTGDVLKHDIPKNELDNIGADGLNAKDFSSFCKDVLGISEKAPYKTYRIEMDDIQLYVDKQVVHVERPSSRFSVTTRLRHRSK